jgi:hypothetical protein
MLFKSKLTPVKINLEKSPYWGFRINREVRLIISNFNFDNNYKQIVYADTILERINEKLDMNIKDRLFLVSNNIFYELENNKHKFIYHPNISKKEKNHYMKVNGLVSKL